MALDHRLARLRPYLYHLTAEENLPAIRRHGELRCAKALLQAAGLGHAASQRRLEHLLITTDIGSVLIRDQKPLAAGAIEFEEGWNLERFVAHVNEHVFEQADLYVAQEIKLTFRFCPVL